jgi:glycosyltransferase involved in cell wall biosynthesis
LLERGMPINLSYSLADQEFARTKSIGIWNVSTQLLEHLAARPQFGRITVFGNSAQSEISWPGNVNVRTFDHVRGGKWSRLLWDQWGVYSAARRAGNAWLLLPKGYASFVRRCPVRLAVYVHDAMHDHYCRSYRPNPLARECVYFLRSLRAALRQARVVFTNSNFTAGEVDRLAREWNIHCPRVCTAGIGFKSPPIEIQKRSNRILVLAGSAPHKLTALAVDYLSRWTAHQSELEVVDWVGSLPAGLSLPDLRGWKHQARLLPEDYTLLLQRAKVVVYCTAYEGFGMPPVEAALSGAVPVFSSLPPLREVMGDCGFAFANHAYESFADAMNRALTAPPEQLAIWRKELSQRHGWEQVAGRIAHALAAEESAP